MKGRNNYLCRKKLYDLTDQPVLSGLEEIEHYRAIAAWEKTTQTGDRAELAELPEASALWHKLDARADACLGQKCSSWDSASSPKCTAGRWRATSSSSIIICFLPISPSSSKPNARRMPAFCRKLGAVIFDEAHELEDVAGSYFGVSVSNVRVEELCRDVEHRCSAITCFRLRFRARWEACASGRCFSLRCCRRAKGVSHSRTGANSWKKTATSSWRCNSR